MATLLQQRNAVSAELATLDAARAKTCRRMHFSTVFGILQGSGLPYTLVQDWTDLLGVPLRHGYRYRFTSRWSSPATLYIQETSAGRQHASMGSAIADLRAVLRTRLRELDNALEKEKQR